MEIVLLPILILGFIVRLILINQSFWLDEAIGLLAAKNQSFWQIITQFSKGDNHPPLYYLSLKAWGDIFGYSESSVRTLSILLGVATVFLVYKIAQLLISKVSTESENSGLRRFFPLVSAFLLAISPLHIYYSQEARMYIMSGFLATGLIYFFLKTIFDKAKIIDWIFLSIFSCLLPFSDYMPIFLFPVFPLMGIVFKKSKKWWLNYVLSLIPLLILGIFWLPIFVFQSNAGKIFLATLPAWKNVAGGASVRQFILVWNKFILGRISISPRSIYIAFLGVASINYLISIVSALKKIKSGKSIVFPLLFWLLIPLILGFLASFTFPAFIYFRYIYVLPAFVLLSAWGIVNIRKRSLAISLLALTISLSLFGWLYYVSNPSQQRENWKQAVEFIKSNLKEDEIVLFPNPEPFAPFRWYGEGIPAYGGTDSISPAASLSSQIVSKAVKGRKGIYFFSYLKDLMDPENIVLNSVFKEGFKQKASFAQFEGVGEIIYLSRQ